MKLKLLVNFKGTRVMVPCGGEVSVKELSGLAVSRYKRAIEADGAQDHRVTVLSLR